MGFGFIEFICSFLVIFLLQFASGDIKIVQPYPPNIYPIEGTADSTTCIAQGVTDEVRFVRRTASGRFAKYPETERVFTTNYTVGDKIYFTLNFKEIKIEDDSTVERYECWAHKIGDKTEEWDNSAKHGFNVQVIRRDSLPTVIPSYAVVMQKTRGESFSIACNISIPERPLDVKPEAIYWLKNEVIIQTLYADAGKFRTTLKPLVFSSVSPKDGGNYSCILETKLKKIRPYNITGGPYIINIEPDFKSKKLDDNEVVKYKENDAIFGCSAVGFPLSIKWEMKLRDEESWKTLDVEYNVNDTHYSLVTKEEYEASDLQIINIQYSDRGCYRCCIVRVNETDRCQEFVLRVRDPLGPLWPVIGIVVEAIILFLIIFFTERSKKNKKEAVSVDGRVEFKYVSTPKEGTKGHVRLRSVGDTSLASET